MEKKIFKYNDSLDNSHEIEISEQEFEFVQKDSKIHDVKLKGKPTTFFKDSMKRFVKNKSSLAGGIILGVLVLISCIVPWAIPSTGAYDVYQYHTSSNFEGISGESLIVPKLFPRGTGFWDGTVSKSNIIFNQETGLPVGYSNPNTIFDLVTRDTYSDVTSQYGTGGYILLTGRNSSETGNLYENPYTYYSYKYDFDFSNDFTLDYSFILPNDNEMNYLQNPEYRISLMYRGENNEMLLYPLTGDYNGSESIEQGTADGFVKLEDEEVKTININEKIKQYGIEKLDSASILIDLKRSSDEDNINAIFIKNLHISSTNEEVNAEISKRNIVDGNNCLIQPQKISPNGISRVDNPAYWAVTANTQVAGRDIKITYCDFRFDQYEDLYGEKEITLNYFNINTYQNNGWLEYNAGKASTDKAELASRLTVFSDKCPIVEIIEQVGDATYNPTTGTVSGYSLKCVVSQYKLRGYDNMPIFIFGTDSNGRDFFKLIFTGLILSLALGIGVSAVNIIIGLVWGSISGYFGGWTDIVMERLCDIIGGMPSIAVITLALIYMDSDVIAFMIALFMTGWMGVSARTRTQFYRFKGREYVLASRTLGAKDGRLIFRHILPNSLGTIITSSILLVPSVISSEASIAYLGLGLQNQILFGVILSENRNQFVGDTIYLLIIPTVIFALLLISFNLFGNGLRDAFNPSLKGEE